MRTDVAILTVCEQISLQHEFNKKINKRFVEFYEYEAKTNTKYYI